ncbi:uncharacterized mitochondrial protein-like protein [Tanacetum coccineum]
MDNSKRGHILMQERLDLNESQGKLHWTAVKNILKYLRNTKDMFLVYGGNPSTELRVDCYCNAGFETDIDDMKYLTGYVSSTYLTLEARSIFLPENKRGFKLSYPDVESDDLLMATKPEVKYVPLCLHSNLLMTKELTLTFQCPVLTSTNYTTWSMRMEILLGIHGVWDVIDPSLANAKKNNTVKGVDRVKEARLQTLITKFKNQTMLNNGTIDEYDAKLSGIASKSATLGEVMSEHKLVKKFLTSLPRRFIHIVAALEQVLDLKTTGFEDVVGQLKAYEERVKEEDKANDPPENLLYARTEYSNRNSDSSEEEDVTHTLEVMDEVEVKDVVGATRKTKYRHFISKCPERNRNHEVNLNETQEKGVYHEEALQSNVISLGQEKISDYDISIRAQLKVGKEGTNEVRRESDKEENQHSSLVTVHETSPESKEDHSRSDGTPIPIARLKTIRLLIALTAGKGWKIHHLDVKTAFLNGDQKKVDSTLVEMGFLQCVHEKAVYRKVSIEEFIIIAVYGDDIFVTRTWLDLINEFKRRMASQFKRPDLGELTYYLGIEVSQGKDCVEIKQERYARKILKEAGMEDCNETSYPMEKDLKLSKAEDEPEVEATQYRKVVGCLCYLLHTRLDLTYSVGVVSRYMQSLRESHARAIKQILRYLKGTTSFGIKYKWGNDMRLVGYSSHNVNIDDGRSNTGYIFYLGTSPITWCSKKQATVTLSSCEAEFMAATAAACQAICLKEVLTEVMKNEQNANTSSTLGSLSQEPSITTHTKFTTQINELLEMRQTINSLLFKTINESTNQSSDSEIFHFEERIKELELRTQRRNNFKEELFKDKFPTEEELTYHKELLGELQPPFSTLEPKIRRGDP